MDKLPQLFIQPTVLNTHTKIIWQKFLPPSLSSPSPSPSLDFFFQKNAFKIAWKTSCTALDQKSSSIIYRELRLHLCRTTAEVLMLSGHIPDKSKQDLSFYLESYCLYCNKISVIQIISLLSLLCYSTDWHICSLHPGLCFRKALLIGNFFSCTIFFKVYELKRILGIKWKWICCTAAAQKLICMNFLISKALQPVKI